MRKSLCFILVFALGLSMFSAAVSAADDGMTAQEKFDELKTKAIFSGFPDGSAGLDQPMTRAQFATVVYRILLGSFGDQFDWPDGAGESFRDVPATHWAHEAIEAVHAAGFFQGVGNNRFDPQRNVTIQELAAAYVRTLGLTTDPQATVEGASGWAGPSVRAALDAELIDAGASFQAAALRSDLVSASYTVNEIVESLLELKVVSIAAVDSRHVRVVLSDGNTFDTPVWSTTSSNSPSETGSVPDQPQPATPAHFDVKSASQVQYFTAIQLSSRHREDVSVPIESIVPVDDMNVRVALSDGSTFDSFILGEVRDDGSFILESSEIFNGITGMASLDEVTIAPVQVIVKDSIIWTGANGFFHMRAN